MCVAVHRRQQERQPPLVQHARLRQQGEITATKPATSNRTHVIDEITHRGVVSGDGMPELTRSRHYVDVFPSSMVLMNEFLATEDDALLLAGQSDVVAGCPGGLFFSSEFQWHVTQVDLLWYDEEPGPTADWCVDGSKGNAQFTISSPRLVLTNADRYPGEPVVEPTFGGAVGVSACRRRLWPDKAHPPQADPDGSSPPSGCESWTIRLWPIS